MLFEHLTDSSAVAPAEPFPNPKVLNLYFYNESTKTAPLKLLQLTTDFSDITPFGDFKVDALNAALTAIGQPTVGGATPLGTLIKGRNLLGALISTDGKAAVGLITDDPNVGPEIPDFNEVSYLSIISSNYTEFGAGLVSLVNA